MTTRTTISTTTLLRCVCQRQPRSALQFRQASSSSLSSSSTAKKPGLYTRIKEAAEAATYKFRPLSPRAELAVQRQQEKQDGLGSLLQKTLEEAQEAVAVNEEPQLPTSGYVRSGKVYTQHKTSTGTIPISPRKLNAVGRLIAGKPIDSAILQMQMSDKRVAHTRIKSMLVLARDHAVMKGLRRERLVVQEAWVSKGVYLRRIEPRGRGKFGIRMKPEARMHVVLAPGLSREEAKQKEMKKEIAVRMRSGAGYVREDRPIINIGNMPGHGVGYAW